MSANTAGQHPKSRLATFAGSYEGRLAIATLIAIAAHLILIFTLPDTAPWWISQSPLIVIVIIGGAPLVWEVLAALARREAGVDLLAAVAIVSSVAMGEWPVGAIIVRSEEHTAELQSRGHLVYRLLLENK